MPEDRITVDEALISTDVDRLIKIISVRKRADIRQLEQATSLDRKSIEKWLHVLEDEGYITIDYRITNMVVAWTGPEGESGVSGNRENFTYQATQPTAASPYAPDAPEIPAKQGKKEEAKETTTVFTPLPETSPAPASEVPARKTEPSVGEKTDNAEESKIKTTILNAWKSDGESSPSIGLPSEPFVPTPEEVRSLLQRGIRGERKPDEPETESVKKTVNKAAERLIRQEFSSPEPAARTVSRSREVPTVEPDHGASEEKPLPAPTFVLSGSARETIGTYMEEINKQKKEIAKLKEDKERIYREGYATLESRMGSDIATLTERILEKETRILELKERLLDLPDRVEEIEKLARKVDRIRIEGRKSMEETRERIERFLDGLEKTGHTLLDRAEQNRRTMEAGKVKSAELLQLSQQVEAQMEQLRTRLADTQAQIGELDQSVRTMLESMEKVGTIRNQISEASERVARTIADKEGELDTHLQSLEEVRKVGQWMREYVADYEVKIDEIDAYVTQSEEELGKIREAAEAEYMRRYLRELEGLTRNYQGELGDVMDSEKEIDKKLEQARQRLKKLLEESQETIRRLTKSALVDERFDPLKEKAREAAREKRGRIEEKEREYERLAEDARNARSGKRRNVPAPEKAAEKKKDRNDGKKKGRKGKKR